MALEYRFRAIDGRGQSEDSFMGSAELRRTTNAETAKGWRFLRIVNLRDKYFAAVFVRDKPPQVSDLEFYPEDE